MKSKQIQEFSSKKLSEICKIILSGTPKTSASKYWNGDIKWVTPTDIAKINERYIHDTERKITKEGIKNSSAKLLKKDTIIISSRGTVGELCLIPFEMSCNQSCYALEVIPEFLRPLYLFYILKSLKKVYAQIAHGTIFDTITKTTFDEIKIDLPSLAEQDKLIPKLDTLDSKIENLQKQNKILEQIAQTIFKSWFVDFDDQAEFADSELGKIPKGWKVVNMPEIIEINPSRSLKKNSLAPYLGMTDIPIYSSRISRFYLRIFTSGTKFINGDTLVARITPSLENGKTAFVDFLQNNEVGWGSTEYIVLRPRNPLPPEYGYCFARTDEFRSHAIANMTGTSGRQRVPENCFDDYKVVAPPIGLAETFGKISKKLFLKIRENGEMCDVLTTLRDSLLPKLMSGEIRV